ncbi:MAG: HD domain-containing protein [Chitinispirillaceae bacterium]
MNERLRKQIEFIIEIDKIKHIIRQTGLFDGSRRENDAEHAWHLAVMAMVLHEHANEEVDVPRVIKMVLIHDLVEIDAGDVPVYETKKRTENEKNERDAARRIFGLLPRDQAEELIDLWEEFEAKKTPEARFAAALDRMEPVMQNFMTQGQVWKKFGVDAETVTSVNRHIRNGSDELWNYVEKIISDSVEMGFLKE